MSKTSKKISKDKNLQRKRAIKMANKAKYAAWRAAGENSKSLRATRKAKSKKSPFKHRHLITHCGNPACSKCFIHDAKGVRAKKPHERI